MSGAAAPMGVCPCEQRFSIVRIVRHANGTALQAFCDVAVGDHVLIRGVRVVNGDNGPFVSMPRQQGKNGKWYESVVILSPEDRARLCRTVLDALKEQEPSQ